MNINEQHLNNPICENIDEIYNDKENHLTSEEDRTQQVGYDKTNHKGENITYDENITQHDREQEKGENYEDTLTDDIEVLK